MNISQMKEKTFAKFNALWLFTKVFSAKFVGVASVAPVSNWQKFSAIITGKFTMNSTIMIFIVQHNCILSCKCKTKWGIGRGGGGWDRIEN